MTPETISLGKLAKSVIQNWQTAHARILGAGLSNDASNASTPGINIGEFGSRLIISMGLIAKLEGLSHENLAILAPRAQNLFKAIDAIDKQCALINDNLKDYQGCQGIDTNGHLNIQLSHPEHGNRSVNLGSFLLSISQQLDSILVDLPLIAIISGDNSVEIFHDIARAASSHLAAAQDAVTTAKKSAKDSESLARKINDIHASAGELLTKIQALLNSTGEKKKSADENSAEITQRLANIREISRDADTLQHRVTEFSSKFQAFDAQMTGRLAQFNEFEAGTKEANRLAEEREKNIDELIKKADDMIRGATTAGLSKSLDDTKQDYERRLRYTQYFFLGSVCFLLLSVLPIVSAMIPGPWQEWFKAPLQKDSLAQVEPWISTLGKIILIIPGTWAAAFFAKNYAELFHLSREYAHKAALAKAIDGFKREAPNYKEEIIASVFMEIQENPGSRPAPAVATPENPVTKKLFEVVTETIKMRKG